MQLVQFISSRAGTPNACADEGCEDHRAAARTAMAGMHASIAVFYARRFGTDSLSVVTIEETETSVARFAFSQEDSAVLDTEALTKRMLIALAIFLAAGPDNATVCNLAEQASEMAVEIIKNTQPNADNGSFLRAGKMVQDGIDEVKKSFEDNAAAIAAVTSALLANDTLTGDQLKSMLA